MKWFSSLLVLSLLISAAAIADLPEGHWLSEKLDTDRKVILTYENWFEKNEDGVRVFRSKLVKETPSGDSHKHPVPTPVDPVAPSDFYYCFSHDYIDVDESPRDESCIKVHYKSKGRTLALATENALRQCHRRSKLKSTCEVHVKKDCFAESTRFGFGEGK